MMAITHVRWKTICRPICVCDDWKSTECTSHTLSVALLLQLERAPHYYVHVLENRSLWYFNVLANWSLWYFHVLANRSLWYFHVLENRSLWYFHVPENRSLWYFNVLDLDKQSTSDFKTVHVSPHLGDFLHPEN